MEAFVRALTPFAVAWAAKCNDPLRLAAFEGLRTHPAEAAGFCIHRRARWAAFYIDTLGRFLDKELGISARQALFVKPIFSAQHLDLCHRFGRKLAVGAAPAVGKIFFAVARFARLLVLFPFAD